MHYIYIYTAAGKNYGISTLIRCTFKIVFLFSSKSTSKGYDTKCFFKAKHHDVIKEYCLNICCLVI